MAATNLETEVPANDTDSAIAAGEQLADIKSRVMMLADAGDPTRSIPIGLVRGKDGSINVEPLTDAMSALDTRASGPRRRSGHLVVTDATSFVAAVNRWGSPATVIYADVEAMKFAAVLDDHPGSPRPEVTQWRDHRVNYACPRSPEWLTWTSIDGKALTQLEFAELIESRLEDLVGAEGMPKPTEILQMARNLSVRTKGTYQREFNPTNGDSVLVCKTEQTSDSTPIPRAFSLAIPVFEAGERYQVEARIRFALTDRGPQFVVVLHRRKEIERDAFDGVRTHIAGATEQPHGVLILSGRP